MGDTVRKRQHLVRKSFIAIVKQMDPLDARVLKVIFENAEAQAECNSIAASIGANTNDVVVSFERLKRRILVPEKLRVAGEQRRQSVNRGHDSVGRNIDGTIYPNF